MTALIKGDDPSGLLLVRSLGTSPGVVLAPASSAALPPETDDCTPQLETALSEARDDLAALRRQHAADIEKIRAGAHAEGVAEGVRRNGLLRETLAKAATRAEATMSEALQASFTLSLAITRSALGQIFADQEQWRAMVADIIGVRRAQIDRDLLLGIRVSAKDFPNEESIAGIASDKGRVTIVADPGLASGECVFELRLGEMEVGPVMQGRNLLAFLDRQLMSGKAP
ncbi:type III secretion protein L [Sphingopyxis panaciterrae]|uniref:hypothetical protein n=1 Tax=Sphingopyxis panaciterrae TaxID=363841 RepID=UPI0014218409|nr:hypothetical protein [Sphingopyxis panaciterrae]NIJ36963.1 type III secretion protein L [Sphingopyxis panaciterrae]